MNLDIATRFAATTEKKLTVEQVQSILAEFFKQLIRCPVCDGEGTFTYGRDVQLYATEDPNYPDRPKQHFVKAGTVGPCPRCGPSKEGGAPNGDPSWVQWVCVNSSPYQRCSEGTAKRGDGHEECGHRIVLPLDLGQVQEDST